MSWLLLPLTSYSSSATTATTTTTTPTTANTTPLFLFLLLPLPCLVGHSCSEETIVIKNCGWSAREHFTAWSFPRSPQSAHRGRLSLIERSVCSFSRCKWPAINSVWNWKLCSLRPTLASQATTTGNGVEMGRVKKCLLSEDQRYSGQFHGRFLPAPCAERKVSAKRCREGDCSTGNKHFMHLFPNGHRRL